jgi:hypothetical protein
VLSDKLIAARSQKPALGHFLKNSPVADLEFTRRRRSIAPRPKQGLLQGGVLRLARSPPTDLTKPKAGTGWGGTPAPNRRLTCLDLSSDITLIAQHVSFAIKTSAGGQSG